ncbi:MAG TPA: DUF5668 domain-containing protein [Vicinamibacteria bacterium]|nr:DUF5668 domain-containing protein [Vicinamibacteria bacterium]
MKRSPSAALWLSLLPGIGHVYIGQGTKGMALILLAASAIHIAGRSGTFGILIPFVWLYAMLDAYRAAMDYNRALETGKAPADPPSAALSKWWGVTLIVLGVLFTLHNADIIDFDFIWDYWPVVLIALGIYILTRKPTSPGLETRSDSSFEAPPPPVETDGGDAETENA